MIRESIARHLGADPVRLPPSPQNGFGGTGKPDTTRDLQQTHASFVRLPHLPSGDADGACLIEPAVRCNHCGFCLSYGH